MQFVSNTILITNYIRQEYFSTRFVLCLNNPCEVADKLAGSTTYFDLVEILGFDLIEDGILTKDILLSILEFEDLEKHKLTSRKILDYNKTVNNNQIKFLAFAYGIEIGSERYLDENVRAEFILSGKSPVFFEIQRTATKVPVMGVGGGSMSNLLSCRYILTSRKKLKRAVFIKHTGDICNSKNQALVAISENEFIVDIHGTKPLDVNNSDLKIKIYRIVAIHETKVECEDITESRKWDKEFIPKKVVEGAHTYHNRDGSYFCAYVTKKVKEEKLSISNTEEK
jgi:hypothetical protein